MHLRERGDCLHEPTVYDCRTASQGFEVVERVVNDMASYELADYDPLDMAAWRLVRAIKLAWAKVVGPRSRGQGRFDLSQQWSPDCDHCKCWVPALQIAPACAGESGLSPEFRVSPLMVGDLSANLSGKASLQDPTRCRLSGPRPRRNSMQEPNSRERCCCHRFKAARLPPRIFRATRINDQGSHLTKGTPPLIKDHLESHTTSFPLPEAEPKAQCPNRR